METFPWDEILSAAGAAVIAIIGWLGGKAKGRQEKEKELTGRR